MAPFLGIWKDMGGGLGNVHHSPWGLRWWIWQGACLLGTREGSGDGHRSTQGLCYESCAVHSPGTLRDNWRVPWTEHLSLWAFCEGNLEGGSITGDPEGYIEGSGDGHLFPQVLHWGPGRGLIYQRLRDMDVSLHSGPTGEPGKGGSNY
jgi:hypothetical protein